MDPQGIWGNPSEAHDGILDRVELTEVMDKLRRQLRTRMFTSIAGLIFFAFIAFMETDDVLNWWCLRIMLLAMAVMLVGGYYHYRQLPDHLDRSLSLLPLLKAYETIVRKALRFDVRVGAIIIIPAPALGVLFGDSMGSGEPMLDMLSVPGTALKLFLVTVVFAPLGIWATIRMNRSTFGAGLKALRENIEALEKL